MKSFFLIMAMGALSACSGSQDNLKIEGVPIAENASGMLLTTKPSEQVARCLGAANQSAPQAITGGFAVVAPDGTSYHVMAFADPLERYTTRVEIFGYSEKTSAAGLCL